MERHGHSEDESNAEKSARKTGLECNEEPVGLGKNLDFVLSTNGNLPQNLKQMNCMIFVIFYENHSDCFEESIIMESKSENRDQTRGVASVSGEGGGYTGSVDMRILNKILKAK